MYAELTLKNFSLHWANVQMIFPLDFSNAAMILEFTETQQRTLNVKFFSPEISCSRPLGILLIGWDPAKRNPSPILPHLHSYIMYEGALGQPKKTTSLCDHMPKTEKNFSCLYTFKLKDAVVRAMIFVLRYFCMV
jgi:hypothetical protein